MIGFEAASVSDLVNAIKDTLEEQFHEVMVQGEVTNLSPSAAGHWYFTLSDDSACISCALFKGDALRNPLIRNLKNGDKIVVAGPVSVYQKKGSFQILARRILPAGEGQLKLQFERLKAKLSQEGLFDIAKKKAIPLFPKKIVVITAEHGAALQDFLNVMKRRTMWMDILIIPAVVQGEGSARSLVSALRKAEVRADADVIVFTRGGGSIEDLWSFNDEELVRAIAACPIPVISAVGHQVDFTLCDYVADLRSETPTAAAETLSQPQTELKGRLTFCQTHLRSELFKLNQKVQLMTERFHPRGLLLLISQKLQAAHRRLTSYNLIDRSESLLGIAEAAQNVDDHLVRLTHCTERKFARLGDHLKRLEHVLGALNPGNVLQRGYAYLQTENGKVVTTLKQFEKLPGKARIELHFNDGVGTATKDGP